MKFKIIFLSLIMFLCFSVRGNMYHVVTNIECLDSGDLFNSDLNKNIDVSVGGYNIDNNSRGSLACDDGKSLSFNVVPKDADPQLSKMLSEAGSSGSKVTVIIKDTDSDSKPKTDSNSKVSVLQ